MTGLAETSSLWILKKKTKRKKTTPQCMLIATNQKLSTLQKHVHSDEWYYFRNCSISKAIVCLCWSVLNMFYTFRVFGSKCFKKKIGALRVSHHLWVKYIVKFFFLTFNYRCTVWSGAKNASNINCFYLNCKRGLQRVILSTDFRLYV